MRISCTHTISSAQYHTHARTHGVRTFHLGFTACSLWQKLFTTIDESCALTLFRACATAFLYADAIHNVFPMPETSLKSADNTSRGYSYRTQITRPFCHYLRVTDGGATIGMHLSRRAFLHMPAHRSDSSAWSLR